MELLDKEYKGEFGYKWSPILTIPSQDCAVPPMRILLVKLQAQLLHKDSHHALVGV
jgi:hypothetical protein